MGPPVGDGNKPPNAAFGVSPMVRPSRWQRHLSCPTAADRRRSADLGHRPSRCAWKNAFCRTKLKSSVMNWWLIRYDGSSHFETPEDALDGLRKALRSQKRPHEGGTNYVRITLVLRSNDVHMTYMLRTNYAPIARRQRPTDDCADARRECATTITF